MPTSDGQLTPADRTVLTHVLDQIIPPDGDFPGAGGLGLAERVERSSQRSARLRSALLSVLDALSLDISSRAEGGYAALEAERQISALTTVESSLPEQFAGFIELVYETYYTDDRVYKRIGWAGRPPQPEGFDLDPWDPAILENTRKRAPFWRQPA
ncbi:MAG: gluconate 2-dehydrogenase subunit 3 family protein [Chloroflexi bacterium]|nr:gluconate 2-dehydrogenase subunit 3 family protein [Chloroflexota bacterium]